MLPLWYLIIGGLLSIITVVGNGIVIYLIATRRRLYNPANWIILSLAVADFSIGAGVVVTRYLQEASMIEYDLRYSIISFLFSASAINLCAMTIDRYIFITKPLRYFTLMSTRRAVLLIFTAWMSTFLPHFIYYLKYKLQKDPGDLKRFMTFDLVVFEMLPPVFLSCVVGHIFYVVRQRSRQTDLQMAQLRFNKIVEPGREVCFRKNQRNSSVKVIGAAVTVFVICCLNELCYTVVYQLTEGNKGRDVYRNILHLLYTVNSAFNPVAYALFKSDIKRGLKSMFCCNGAE